MFSKEISTNIMQYLQEKEELSVDSIAEAMNISSDQVQKIINKKSCLTVENVLTYLKNTNTKLWKFSIETNLIEHLPKKIKKRMLICKEISDHIKKKTCR